MKTLSLFAVLALGAALTWGILTRIGEQQAAAQLPDGARAPVPVQLGPVERGAITLRRTFSGTLEASAEFVAAPKVGGRIRRLTVDLGDTVERGQVVAYLDDEELVQAVHEAEAEIAVARASYTEAEGALEIAERSLERTTKLIDDGVTSDSQLDVVRAEVLASRARAAVTKASIQGAEAALEAARIRLGYARVTADWSEGDGERVVAERFVDEGGTVSANAALLSVVDLDPVVSVVNVPERDYASLAVDQVASLTTDSYPARRFEARVTRISPVFENATRQARVELVAANAEELLKPGMFVRATLELDRIEDATIVPFDALCERDGVTGVFALDTEDTVAWRPVVVGIREGSRVQVTGADLPARVVTLGQELCDDGSRITVPDDEPQVVARGAVDAADANEAARISR